MSRASAMYLRAGLVGATLLLIGAVGCGEASVEAPAETVIVADSAGIRIVTHLPDADVPACEVSEENLRIGSVEGDASTALYGVRDLEQTSDGRIVVVNRGTAQVKIFSPFGEFLSEFGREGDGPGEFRNLWSVDVRAGDAAGDTVVTGDYRPWRFSLFTSGGTFVRSVQLEPVVFERPDFAAAMPSGHGFIVEEPFVGAGDDMIDRFVPLRVHAEDGSLVDTVGVFWLDEWGYLSREISRVGSPIFGAKASFTPFLEDRLVYASGRHEQLEILDTEGTIHTIIRWTGRDRAVPPGDADEWRRRRLAALEERFEITPENQVAIDAQVGDHLPVAELYPGHGRVLTSPEGRIWVQEYRRPFDQGPDPWRVFDEAGALLCTASLPGGEVYLPGSYHALDIAANRILGIVRDELDVEYVVGRTVVFPEPDGR